MDFSTPSQIGTFIQTIMNDQFMLISVVTFFVCEAIFNAFPIHAARMKQLTSLVVGGILGLFLLKIAPFDAFLQGLLAGGATTITVAKFKKPSAVAIPETVAAQDPVPVAPIVTPSIAATDLGQVEHL